MSTSLLLDSHAVLWLIKRDNRIGIAAKRLIEDADKVYVSAASIWELNIKAAQGKLDLPENFEPKIIKTGFIELPVNFDHATIIKSIILPHGDPFDKMLVAQASVENLTFLTADRNILATSFNFVVDVTK